MTPPCLSEQYMPLGCLKLSRRSKCHSYAAIAQAEILYRGIDVTPIECLWDVLEAALCIASRGKIKADEYPFYVKGIRNLRGHIYAEYYTPEVAAVRALKVLYMASCLLTGTKFTLVDDQSQYIEQRILSENLMPLRYLRKANPEAYAYAVKADSLLPPP